VRLRWAWLLDNLDLPLAEAESHIFPPTAWWLAN
jgi:hypothetical protein